MANSRNDALAGHRRQGWERIRLSEWARREGVSRITAYRMLRRGILPVPYERSPTGRWYVLVPEPNLGRIAIYARADPGPDQLAIINEQSAFMAQWAIERHHDVFTSVTEIARVPDGPLPRLERLLADRGITFLLVDNHEVLGASMLRLLGAALAPQGRGILLARPNAARRPHS